MLATPEVRAELEAFMEGLQTKNPNEPEFIQAVEEVAESVFPFLLKNRQYYDAKVFEKMCEPERIFIFQVPWIRDNGELIVNRGYRVQINSALGPYKGGLRFHPSVNLSILKFLAFEQTFKNSLTTLPMGAGKGGSNFNPKGKSDREVMAFCQSFMEGLSKYIGANTDIPAGDIGVGAREVGFLFGKFKKLRGSFEGVMTGKGLSFGGSLIRTEATGYGSVYFTREMLASRKEEIKGKTCVVSGSGNVSVFTTEKIIELGGKVVTLSDSSGYIYDEDGITREKLEFVKDLKFNRRGRISEYAEKYGCHFEEGATPWNVPCQLAFPSATQNELHEEDAKTLVANGVMAVSEGANMPSTIQAVNVFRKAKILYGPGKAANAGGVAVSGLEMAQNSIRLTWTRERVDEELQRIMREIHRSCERYGGDGNGYVDYVTGANLAGFVKVADAMIAQGWV